MKSISALDILRAYSRMGIFPARQLYGKNWYGVSQYGYANFGPYKTRGEAVRAALAYYTKNPHLIFQ